MRLDKYLKVSRLIRRRTVAQSACEGELVVVNGKPQKSSYQIKLGDVLEINLGKTPLKVRVCKIEDSTKKADAAQMYEVVN